MTRRGIRTAALSLGAGAALTLGIAVTGALGSDLAGGTLMELYTELANGYHWEVYRWDTALGTRVFSRAWGDAAIGPFNHGDPSLLMPRWGSMERPALDTPQEQVDVQEGFGFPFRALGCGARMRMGDDKKMTTAGYGVLELREKRGFSDRGLYLPLQPLWGGLALDTILFGLGAMVSGALARDLRKAYRRRRAVALASN